MLTTELGAYKCTSSAHTTSLPTFFSTIAPVPAFNDEEVTYLQTLLTQYQRSTGQEKAGLREKSAKHIVSLRQEDEANNHAMDLYTIRIKTWFLNHTTTKKQCAPLEVGRRYFGERVFGCEEKVKVSEAAAGDTLKDWNLSRWELWEKLSEEDREKYDLMAEEWNEKGPTDAQKAQYVFAIPNHHCLILGHSQAAGDALLFKPEVMRKLPTLQAWYDEPDGDEASKFSTMTIPAFKQWQKEELKKGDRKSRKGKEKEKAGKKRARSVSSDSDRKGTRGAKKGKTAQYDCDKLDESSSEESE
ncbi:hypothetical protein LXA43DRAFT_1119739 [Ganoderma leucocontextum]|nr:hypothetical protein LXA43DRAFT_1119739 [Ganoderma leucocontextum]